MTLKAFTFAGAEQPAERGLLSLARLSPCAFFRKSKAAGFVPAIQAALGAAPEGDRGLLAGSKSFLQGPSAERQRPPPLRWPSCPRGWVPAGPSPSLTSVLGVADKFPAVERQLLSGFLTLPPELLFHLFLCPSEISLFAVYKNVVSEEQPGF